jgi:alpha-beta hydrolase superfamily lysophospholipase
MDLPAMPQPTWTADLLPGFEQMTLTGFKSIDAPVDVVLVRRRSATPTPAPHNKPAVLYVHGYIDYFFQTHLADFYNARGLDFYAVDLRRHGRSLRSHQLPNFTDDIAEYFQDLDAVMAVLRGEESVGWLLLNGHSTGGLVAALYAHRGKGRSQVDALFLNSPFFDMNLPRWWQRSFRPVLVSVGASFPGLEFPGMPAAYGQSLHADHHGRWHYNTDWKPIAGFPVFAGWFRAVCLAHAEVARGLQIECPCLVLHAERSLNTQTWTEEAMSADIVLNVAQIQRLSPQIGKHVEVQAIAGGMHDLVLSDDAARGRLWAALGAWLDRVAPEKS